VNAAERFGANLSRFRAAAGLTQEELGHLSSIHRTEIGMLERGQRQPRLETIVKVAGALGVDPGELIEGIRWTPPSTKPGEIEIS
jgi:transcriptional regulator with XRE-family HTH domain